MTDIPIVIKAVREHIRAIAEIWDANDAETRDRLLKAVHNSRSYGENTTYGELALAIARVLYHWNKSLDNTRTVEALIRAGVG